MLNVKIIDKGYAKFATLNVDIKKLNYTSNDQKKVYLSKSPRKDNLIFENKTYLNECISKCTYGIMNAYDQKKPFTIECTGIWEHEYIENDWQEEHIHYGNHFSFIIYKKGKSYTVFRNPSAHTLIAYYQGFENYLGGYHYKPDLDEGSMILFPSYIPHFVIPHSNTITLAGDLRCNIIK